MAVAGTLTYKTELDTSGVKKAGSTVKSIVAGLGITKMISKAMSTISSSLDDAISRFDTLNNFPKVMSNLGISTEKSQKAIKKMADKLAGLPTTLDQGAMAVQRFTSKNKDVEKSTDIFLALNNALLAGGASTEIQATALEQLSQAYAKGKPDMMEWRSVQTAMPAQLNQISKEMLGNKNSLEKFMKKAQEYAKKNPLSSTAQELLEQLKNVKNGTGDMTTAMGTALRAGVISMDEFMDTIVKLNKKGTKNFKSFEEQARNSTAGIRTAITVAKTQIVKGLTTIIESIDKTLKKSNTSISKIISDLGKKAKKVLEEIGKIIEKIDLTAIYNSLKKILPIIISVTTAWIAYHTILKAITLIEMASGIIKTATAFIQLIPAINSARDAMTLLNLAFDVNPILLIVSAIAGLTAGIIYLTKKSNELNDAQKKQKQAIQEQTDKINQNKEALDNLHESQKQNISAGMSEIAHYQALSIELQNITDNNGRVKKGYEQRAKFIVTELNRALGTEIKMNNNVISGYKNLEQSIQDVIDKKKAQIIIETQEESYTNAIKNKQSALEDLEKAQEQYNSVLQKREELQSKINDLLDLAGTKEYRNFKYIDEAGKAYQGQNAYTKMMKDLQNLNNDLETSGTNLNKQKGIVEQYAYDIGVYENNMALMHQKKYNEMTTATYDYIKKYKDSNNAEQKMQEDKLKRDQLWYNTIVGMQNESNSKILNNVIKSGEQEIKASTKTLTEIKSKTNSTLGEVNSLWNTNLDKQISIIMGKKVEFKRVANGQIQMYIDGIKQGEPKTQQEMEHLAKTTIEKVKNKKSDAKQAGADLVNGVNNGIKNQQGSVFSTISSFGNSILSKLKSSLKEKSPSKATKEMGIFLLEGLEQGIKKEENNTLKQVSNLGDKIINEFDFSKEMNDMYKEMNKTIQLENAKMNFDVYSNNAYNKSLQLPAIIDLSANFEGTIPVQLNLDGEKVWDNQQKISVRKNLQYGGVK